MSKKEIMIYPDKPPSINQIVKELKTLPILSLEAIDLIKRIEKGDEESINKMLIYLVDVEHLPYYLVRITLCKYLIHSEKRYWSIPLLMIHIAVIYEIIEKEDSEFNWYKKTLSYLINNTPKNEWVDAKNVFNIISNRLEAISI